MRKFLINLVVSTIVWPLSMLIEAFLAFLIWIASGSISGAIGRDGTHWLNIMVGVMILMAVFGILFALFFICGRKLHLLGKPWLNYLSVSGSFVVALILYIFNVFGTQTLYITLAPFGALWAISTNFIESVFEIDVTRPLIYAAIALPSIIIWLGMVSKARKNKENNVELISNSDENSPSKP